MVAHTLKLDKPRLNAKGMGLSQKKVGAVTRKTFNRSQVLVPVDTGYLRASGSSSTSKRGLTWIGDIEYTANYAAAVHNGRRALTIRAKAGGRLRFVLNGRVVYARSVHQPARAGRPYLADALRQVAPGEGFTVSIG